MIAAIEVVASSSAQTDLPCESIIHQIPHPTQPLVTPLTGPVRIFAQPTPFAPSSSVPAHPGNNVQLGDITFWHRRVVPCVY